MQSMVPTEICTLWLVPVIGCLNTKWDSEMKDFARRTEHPIYTKHYIRNFFSNHSPFGYLQCVTNNVSNTTMGQHITKPNNFTWTKSHAMHALFTNQTGYLQVRFVFLIIFFFGNILSIENAMDACKKAAEIMIVR